MLHSAHYIVNEFIGFPQLTYVDFRFYEFLDVHRVFESALLEGNPVLKVARMCLALGVHKWFHCYLILYVYRNIWTALRQVQCEERLLGMQQLSSCPRRMGCGANV